MENPRVGGSIPSLGPVTSSGGGGGVGFFDKFLKAKQTAPPPPPAPPSLPLPSGARVETYDAADGVGTLRLDSGESLRFGRSACPGFEPVVEARVVVTAVAPHPRGGLRAKSVSLDPTDTSYDRLLAQRDAKLGLRPNAGTSDEAVAACRALGWITVLMKEEIPDGPQAMRAWLLQFGLAAAGIEASTDAGLGFQVGHQDVTVYVGREPFPREHLDLRQVGDDFATGKAFLGLNIGEPGLLRASRSITDYPDTWGPHGAMRELSRLVVALLARGAGVILNRAGDLVVDGESFVRMLGDLDDPECKPFAAWLDIAIVNEPRVYATFGMAAFGFPDVLVPVDPASSWDRSRSHEAVLYAAYRMIRENRELEEGEALRVPVGLRVGAWPVALSEGDAVEYAVAVRDGMLALQPGPNSVVPGQRWAAATSSANPDLIAPNTYQAFFSGQLAELYPSHVVTETPCENPAVPPHSVQVRKSHDRPGYFIVTNGFGRLIQPGGDEVGVLHAEVFAWVEHQSLALVSLVGRLGTIMHSREPGGAAWKVGDTLGLSLPELGIGGFVLAKGGDVAMPGGAPVTLLMIVPLTASEYEGIRRGGAAAWLAKNVEPPEKRGLLPARWSSSLN
jgi:hypothetical protein